MSRMKISLMILVTALLIPSVGIGDDFKGSIQGFLCVTSGVTCPLGKEDVVAAAENVFVLYQGPEKYYFVSNINVKVMARHVNEQVLLKGDLVKMNSIKADELFVMANGKWRKIWDVDLLSDFYSDILGTHPLKRGQ
jgi:hypothetical protein